MCSPVVFSKMVKFLTVLTLVISLWPSAQVMGLPIPPDGVQKTCYADGTIQMETYFHDGLVIRKKAYYRDGTLLLDEKFEDGQPIYKKSYWDNGRLKSLWTKESGVIKFYHRNGKLRIIVDQDSPEQTQDLPPS